MIVPMTEEYAVRYLDWSYPEPYEFYNIPRAHYDECLEEVMENIPYWFAVIDENDRLLGFYEFSFHEEMCIRDRFVGMTCVEYINHYRLSRAAAALAQSDQPVMEAALENGFHNISYFNKLFRKEFGMTPKEYRRAAGKPGKH